jgi:phosphatidylinositol 4-kinase
MVDQHQESDQVALQKIGVDDDDDDDDEMDMTTTHYKQHQSPAVSKRPIQISVTESNSVEVGGTHSQQDIRSPPIPAQLQTQGLNSNQDQVDINNSGRTSSKRTNLGRSSSSSSFSSSQLHSRQSSQRSTDSSPLTSPSRPFAFSVSLEDLHGGNAFSLSRYLSNHMKWAQSKSFQRMHRMVSGGGSVDDDTPGLDLNTKIMGSSSVPLNDGNPPSPAPFMNGPSTGGDDYLLRRSLTLASTSATNPPQDEIAGHPPPTLEPSSSSTSSFFSPRSSSDSMTLSNKGKRHQHHDQWVRSGYFQYEMQFLVALSDIAERLVALPKQARVSALHAELTLLNHNLPAEICLPLWCSGSCSSLHHRVVRVSPSDAVVLNSAERVKLKRIDSQIISNYSFIIHA